MKLAVWAHANGVHPQTAYRWFRQGTTPVDPGQTSDDLMRDMIEVLTGFCARLHGRRGARNRALRSVTLAKPPPEFTGVEVN